MALAWVGQNGGLLVNGRPGESIRVGAAGDCEGMEDLSAVKRDSCGRIEASFR